MNLSQIFEEHAWQRDLAAKYPGIYKLKNYVGINAVNFHGRTRLMCASEVGDHEAIDNVLKQNANPHLQAIYFLANGRIRYAGTNALICAIQSKNMKSVELLLDAKVNPNESVYYTDPGMGHYTIYPVDWVPHSTAEIRDLLIARSMDMQRIGEWFRMINAAAPKTAP